MENLKKTSNLVGCLHLFLVGFASADVADGIGVDEVTVVADRKGVAAVEVVADRTGVVEVEVVGGGIGIGFS